MSKTIKHEVAKEACRDARKAERDRVLDEVARALGRGRGLMPVTCPPGGPQGTGAPCPEYPDKPMCDCDTCWRRWLEVHTT